MGGFTILSVAKAVAPCPGPMYSTDDVAKTAFDKAPEPGSHRTGEGKRSEPNNSQAATDWSVFNDLVDAIDYARDVPKQLEQKRPQHLNTEAFLDQYRQEGQYQA